MIDLSRIKVGDEVSVRCIVTSIGSAGTFGCKTADSAPDSFRAEPEAIVSHTPKALAVGDRVKISYMPGATATLRALSDARAWVDLTDDGLPLNGVVVGLADLERVS